MAPRTSAVTPIEILAADGTTWIPLAIRRPDPVDADAPSFPTLRDILSAAETDAPVSESLATTVQETFIGGIGSPGNGYNIAPGVYTLTDGVAMAAGAVTQSQVPLGTGATNSPIVAFAEFLGALYFAQEGAGGLFGGRICKSSDGTGAGAGAFVGVAMADYAGHAYLTAGEYVRDLCVFDDGADNLALYASSSDAAILNGRLHRTTDGVTWSSTPAGRFGTNGRGRMRVVQWRGQDNISRKRLVAISGRNKVSYTTSDGADPFLAASWTEGVEIATGYNLTDITGARTHLYFAARDNVFDMNEQGDTPGLLSSSATDNHGGNALCCEYLNDYVYVGSGEGAVRRVYVGTNGQIQETSGLCGPGWGTQARSDWLAGYATAMVAGIGGIMPAVYNAITKRTGVFVGIDKAGVNIRVDTLNPMIWHGPLFTINADYQIKRMYLSTAAGDRRLWMAAQSVTGLQPNLVWGSMPEAGAPLDVLLSDGKMRYGSESGTGIYSPFSRLELLPQTFGDKNSLHIMNAVAIGSEGLQSSPTGTRLTVYQQADPLPTAPNWGTGRDVTTSPTQTLTPTTTLQGHKLQVRVDFVNPSGQAAPPVVGLLESVRIARWDVPPTADVRIVDFEIGSGVVTGEHVSWENLGLDIDVVVQQIKDLTSAGRTTIRMPWDDTVTVKVLQVFARDVSMPERGDARKKVVGQLRLTILDDAA